MAKKKENKPKVKRTTIRWGSEEFNEITKFIEEQTYYKQSEFIREAIREKIDRIKNPEKFNTNHVSISGNTSKILEELQNLKNLFADFIQVNKLIENNKKQFPSKLEDDMDLKENIGKIIDTIEKHRESPSYKSSKTPITMRKIINLTGIKRDLVFDILTNRNDIFEQKGKGWDLKNE